MKARFLAPLVLLAISTAAGDLHAFCRSTTCSEGCSRDSEGCKTEGLPLYWNSLCVGFSLQEDGSEHVDFSAFEKVAADSFVAWSELDCGGGLSSLAFTRLDDVACHRAEYTPGGPNANVVMFQDHRWDYQSEDNTLAKTTVTYDTDTGEILDADIELNHAFNEFTIGDDQVVYDLQSILTHEIGHFIGLDHTLDGSATMNAGYDPGSTSQRDLDFDDVAALCAVYPPDRDATCRPEPEGGLADECASDEQEEAEEGCAAAQTRRFDPFAPFFVAFALVAARRRSRSR